MVKKWQVVVGRDGDGREMGNGARTFQILFA
jgi:hypothetical protein